MNKYTAIVTAYGQIYAKISKSRISNVRRRSPHQNESFFIYESDFQGPQGSKTPKTHISSKSISWTSPIAYKTPAKLKIMPVRVPPVPRMPWKPLAQYIYIYICIYRYRYRYIYIYIIYIYIERERESRGQGV